MSKRKAEVAEENIRSGDLQVGSSLLDRYKRLKTNHDTDNYNRNVKLSNLCPDAPPFVSRKDSACQDDVEKDWRRTVVCKYKHIVHAQLYHCHTFIQSS